MNRRELVLSGIAFPAGIGLLASVSGCQQSEPSACVDYDKLTRAEENSRRSLHYVEESPDPGKTCSVCAFYTSVEGGGACGQCRLFGNGPVNSMGRCDSWSGS